MRTTHSLYDFFSIQFNSVYDEAAPLGKYSWDVGGQKDGPLLKNILEVNKLRRKDLEVHPVYP